MDDPRAYCETSDELAREVLDPREYGEYRQAADERLAVRASRRARQTTTSRTFRDPWGADDE